MSLMYLVDDLRATMLSILGSRMCHVAGSASHRDCRDVYDAIDWRMLIHMSFEVEGTGGCDGGAFGGHLSIRNL
jgi:hypothetical protein